MNEKSKRKYLKDLLIQAQAGDSAAASRLGDAYREGVVTEQDWEQAFRWYTLAARAGDAEAQNNLGTLYLEGYYCTEDFEQAVFWYRKSAEQGACVAQYNIGMRYIHGQGVSTDFKQAMDWLMKSVEQGYPPAFCDLGIMFLHGEGCTSDRARAKSYLIQAALTSDERAFRTLDIMIPELEETVLQGDMDLMFQLPWLYFKGLGGGDYKAKAWAWMLWMEAQGPLPGGMGCAVIDEVAEMRQQFSLSGTSKVDVKNGEALFKSMMIDHTIPRYPTLEEIVAENAEPHSPCSTEVGRLEEWRRACSPDSEFEKPRASRKRGQQVILEVGAEGGGFTLWGTKQSGQWIFWSELDDWTPTMLDEPCIHRQSERVDSWDGAVALLNKHCPYWVNLYPLKVHPEFRERILALAERRRIVNTLIGLEEESL